MKKLFILLCLIATGLCGMNKKASLGWEEFVKKQKAKGNIQNAQNIFNAIVLPCGAYPKGKQRSTCEYNRCANGFCGSDFRRDLNGSLHFD